MKKKYLLMGIAGALMVFTAAAGSLAALNAKTQEGATATISVDNIGVKITEKNKAGRYADAHSVNSQGITPGTSLEISRNVTNTLGTAEGKAYDVYVKAVIYKSWEKDTDGDGIAEYIDVSATENLTEDIVYIGDTPVEKVAWDDGKATVINDWVVGYADEEQIVLFYKEPIAQGETTTDFISSVLFAPELSNDYTNASYQLDFEVTAVQKNNGVSAIAAELGVFPHFSEDGKGTIMSVSENEFEGYSKQVIQ